MKLINQSLTTARQQVVISTEFTSTIIQQNNVRSNTFSYHKLTGISHRGIGPVVFYKGFTRAFLKGETPSAEVLLKSAVDAVKQIR